CTKYLGREQLLRYSEDPSLVGNPTAIIRFGRNSGTEQPSRVITREPNEKPAREKGRAGYRSRRKVSDARASSTSPWPSSCFPWLRFTPRKLKRSTTAPDLRRPFAIR